MINFPTSPTLNQEYTFNNLTWAYNGTAWEVKPATPIALSALSDVTLTSPTNGQSLTYNSTTSKWVNSTPASGGGETISPFLLMGA